MTQKRILELAYHAALELWVEADDKATACHGENTILNNKERRRWKEYMEISKMLEEIKQVETA